MDYEEKIIELLSDNEGNKKIAYTEGGYKQGYYEGYHDAIVDVMDKLKIPHTEGFYN